MSAKPLTDTPCEIHEMPYCGVCAGHDKRQKPRATGVTIAAHYAGTCQCGCGQRWEPGTEITHSTDVDGWVLADHAERGL